MRTVSQSDNGVRFIGMHLLDFVDYFKKEELLREPIAKPSIAARSNERSGDELSRPPHKPRKPSRRSPKKRPRK